jgi:hypothetical protein
MAVADRQVARRRLASMIQGKENGEFWMFTPLPSQEAVSSKPGKAFSPPILAAL